VWWGSSPLRGPGRAAALGVVAAAVLLRALDIGIVPESRLRVFDLEERLWPRSSDPAQVTIVDIDDKSLARYGQWPWPRTLVAELVHRIAEGHPYVLGIDIVFAEPDRLSPPEIARELPGLPAPLADGLAQLPPNEQELADAMRRVPTVLALVPGREGTVPSSNPMRPAPIRQAGGDPTPRLLSYKSLLPSLPALAAAAQGAGAIAAEPDEDGIVRRVALAVNHNGTIIPSFALEVLRIGAAEGSIVIDTGPLGIEDVRIGGLTIPTDRRGRAILHFAPHLARYIPAVDVLDPAFDPGELQSKIVLLGVAGLGIGNLPETPLGLAEGVDIHAQLVESMLLGALLHRPPYLDWIELAVALGAGLAAIWLLPYEQPMRAASIALAIAVVLIGFELASFRFADLLFDGTYPAVTLLAAFGVMLVGNLRAVEAELAREREERQRTDGELAAAQKIQLGLLPRHFPAFPDRPEIDVAARIEPARMVGGDLYDYLLIDRDRRLFFFIADVSGKGIPAALFMATTKEVVRDAALRFGTALDLIVAEANRKTAAASAEFPNEGGDLIFVTAFAGILELATGEIAYASAGHDSPFVLGGKRGLRRLATEGGPPLGASDEFSYPVDHDRIEPGEVLLLYTDGVTEAENADHALYSSERLIEVLAQAPAGNAERAVAAVFEDVHRFVAGADQADDITVLALRRVASGGPSI
jgi:serine phosphatase RsbU (regulator of sigma subunit)/CHASE2 domain-containing sensor protein